MRKGLELQRQSNAGDAAAEAESWLTQVRAHTHRWVRARTAAVLLRREIERYRDRNQGPILRRAGELFARLTRGSFIGLRAGPGDGEAPVLRCVRPDGADVGVEGLSDGTRDALHLALRVASLEHHAAHDEPMPFVVDDVLIHFDDNRASAALDVLAELAATTQVLYFTHHSRICELARAALGDQLREHDLQSLRARAART
jgi:uncharacterized protein YhaN